MTVGNPRPTSSPPRRRRGSASASTTHSAATTWSRGSKRSSHRHAPDAVVTARISGEAFLTAARRTVRRSLTDAIAPVTGVAPELSTTGGTSDARFLSKLCPAVEFGLVNATMHKLDEAVAVADLYALTDIYADVIGCVDRLAG